jgi:hypothetical protein
MVDWTMVLSGSVNWVADGAMLKDGHGSEQLLAAWTDAVRHWLRDKDFLTVCRWDDLALARHQRHWLRHKDRLLSDHHNRSSSQRMVAGIFRLFWFLLFYFGLNFW